MERIRVGIVNDQLVLSAYNIGPGSEANPECSLFIGFAETYHKNQAHVLVPRWWLGEYVVAVIGPRKPSWKDQCQWYEDNKDSSDSVKIFGFVERFGDEKWPAHLIIPKEWHFHSSEKVVYVEKMSGRV